MTEKDIHEATDSETSPSSAPEEMVPADKNSSEEDSESREPVAVTLEEKAAPESESEENLEEETQEKQEEEANEPSEFLQKWQERHEAYLASQKEGDKSQSEQEQTKKKPSQKKPTLFKKKEQLEIDPLILSQEKSPSDSDSENRKEQIPQELIWKATPIIALALSIAIICLYFITPFGKMKQLIIKGNDHVESTKIVKASLIRQEDYVLSTLINRSGHENNIKQSSPWVKDVAIGFSFPNTFTISIQEYNQIGFVKQGEKYFSVLSSGAVSETETSQDQLPPVYTTIHLTDRELIKKLVLQLANVNPSILTDIQDVQLTPSKVTNDLLTLTMFSGHKVLVPLSDIDYKLPYYEKIAPQLQVASIVDMEVGIFSYASP